jgi:hypothetical protein
MNYQVKEMGRVLSEIARYRITNPIRDPPEHNTIDLPGSSSFGFVAQPSSFIKGLPFVEEGECIVFFSVEYRLEFVVPYGNENKGFLAAILVIIQLADPGAADGTHIGQQADDLGSIVAVFIERIPEIGILQVKIVNMPHGIVQYLVGNITEAAVLEFDAEWFLCIAGLEAVADGVDDALVLEIIIVGQVAAGSARQHPDGYRDHDDITQHDHISFLNHHHSL